MRALSRPPLTLWPCLWVALWLALSAAPSAPAYGQRPGGTLTITTPHYGAQVIIDRQPVGLAPVPPQTVRPGLHLVEILVRRRAPWTALVFVEPGAEITLTVAFPAAPQADALTGDTPRALPAGAASTGSSSDGQPLRLTAEATTRSAAAGSQRDTDLKHRWRLQARRLRGLGLDGNLQLRAHHDLDALSHRGPRSECALPENAFTAELPGLTDALDCEGTLVFLDEANLTWRGPNGARIDGGRLITRAPGDAVQTVDGIRGRWRPEAGWIRRLTFAGGRGSEPPTARGPVSWMIHGGITAQAGADEADHLSLAVDSTYAEVHHLDVTGRGRLGPASLRADGRWIGEAPALLRGQGRLYLGAFELRGALARRWAVIGPYVIDGAALGLPQLRPLAGWQADAGLSARRRALGGVVSGGLSGQLQRPPQGEAPTPDRPQRVSAAAEGRWQRGPWALTGWLEAAHADPGPYTDTPAYGDHLWGRLGAQWSAYGLALEINGGWSRRAIVGPAGTRRSDLPEGAVALSAALSASISVSLGVQDQATPPALLASGRRLTQGWLTLRLR